MCPHPVICVQQMCFSISFRFACKFRLKMAPIDNLLVDYLRGWLVWKRLRPIWNRLLWRGLLRNRLMRRGLLWCRLVGQLLGSRLIWRQIRRCIWRPAGALLSLSWSGWFALLSALCQVFSGGGTTGPSIILV